MADAVKPDRPGTGRWVRVTLFLSLALNLLIVGLVAGVILSRAGTGPAPRIDPGIGPYARALSPEDRREIGRTMAGQDRVRLPGPAEQRRAMRAVLQALRAEPFDAAVLARTLERQRQRAGEVLGLAHGALVAQVAQMSPAERAAFADRLAEEFRR